MRYDQHRGIYLPNHVPRKGYDLAAGGTRTRAMRDFNPMAGTASDDIGETNATMRARGRQLYISSPVATAAINTRTTSIVGPGLEPNCRINYKRLGISREKAVEWQKRAEEEFYLWATDARACDAAGLQDFFHMQNTAYKNKEMSGDVCGVAQQKERARMRPYALRVRMVEADRLATPPAEGDETFLPGTVNGKYGGNPVYDGVETDADGLVAAYHFRSGHPNDWPVDENVKWARVLAEDEVLLLCNVMHYYAVDRVDQYRGVTLLAPIMEHLLQLRRYTDSELMAAAIQSYLVAFYTIENPELIERVVGEVGDDRGDTPRGRNPDEYNMGPGTQMFAPPGYDVKFTSPTHPATKFGEFVNEIAVMDGAAIETPADVLLKRFQNSYSASRAARLEFGNTVRVERKWFAAKWCTPIWNRLITEAVILGRLEAPGFFRDPLIRNAYLGLEWIGPAQGEIDPVKEVNALLLQIQNGLNTKENATIQLGNGDYFDNIAQRQREAEAERAAGLAAEQADA